MSNNNEDLKRFRVNLRACFDNLHCEVLNEELTYGEMIKEALWLASDIKREMDFKGDRYGSTHTPSESIVDDFIQSENY